MVVLREARFGLSPNLFRQIFLILYLIDWLIFWLMLMTYKNSSKIILCQEVRESHSLCIYIYISVQLFLMRFYLLILFIFFFFVCLFCFVLFCFADFFYFCCCFFVVVLAGVLFCPQLYDIKYSYIIQIINTQINGFKYSYLILIIIWFLAIFSVYLFTRSYLVSSN